MSARSQLKISNTGERMLEDASFVFRAIISTEDAIVRRKQALRGRGDLRMEG